MTIKKTTNIRKSKPKKKRSTRANKTTRTYRDKRYVRNEKKIISVLCQGIRDRRTHIPAKEFYNSTQLTAPTFYLHHKSSNDVRIDYEKRLISEFESQASEKIKSDMFFTILIGHILRNREYFVATNSCQDYYLLSKVLAQYRTSLVGHRLSDRSFMGYSGKIIIVISCWLELDEINAKTAAKCVRDLMKVRV